MIFIILLNANEGVIPMINTMSETQQIFWSFY